MKLKLIAIILTAAVAFGMVNATVSGAGSDDTNIIKQIFSATQVKNIQGLRYENDKLEMWIEEATAAVYIKNKKTNKVWGTNPSDQELKKVANEGVKEELLSQLSVTYINSKDLKSTSINSFKDCVKKNQFDIEKVENGFRVNYVIGTEGSRMLIPEVMKKKDFEKLIKDLEESDKEYVLDYFSFISYKDIKSEAEKKDMKKILPNIEREDVYLSRKLVNKVAKNLAEIFKKAGLTYQEIDKQYDELSFISQTPPTFSLKITIEYKLDNQGLTIQIPTEEIQYDENAFHIDELFVLKYFGAQSVGHDGYIFVPDGSGALINLDTPKPLSYYKSVYSKDVTFDELEFTGYLENSPIPVFGIKSDADAFIGIIEQGEASAAIAASTSATNNGYNFVNTSYKIVANEEYGLGKKTSNKRVMKFSKKRMNEPIGLRFYFLEGEDATYSGMASVYRNYLFSDKPKLKNQTKAPLFISTNGTIKKQEYFFGIPYTATKELTTYNEAVDMVKYFNQNGIESVNLQYLGWANNGMENTAPTKVSLLKALGGKKNFGHMVSFFNSSQNKLYPDVDFQYITKNTIFDKFAPKKDASRTLNTSIAIKYNPDIVTYSPNLDTTRFIVSPKRFLPFAKLFDQDYQKLGLKTISIGSIGKDLNSNFDTENKEVLRPESQKHAMSVFDYYKDYDILTQYGNAYSLHYVSKVINAPIDASNYDIESYSIPFYQMVTHGYIDYAGEPINLAGDYEYNFLKSIESGSNLHFALNDAPTNVVKGTPYSYLFSTGFDFNKETIVKDYQAISQLLNKVRNSVIVHHNVLPNGLRETKYDNNTIVVVNYEEEDLSYNGQTVKARGFIIQ